jgi:hypothetical protein
MFCARGALFTVAPHAFAVAVLSFTARCDVYTPRRSLDHSASARAAADENFTRKMVNQSFAATACAIGCLIASCRAGSTP